MRKEIFKVNDFTDLIYKELDNDNSVIDKVLLTVFPMVLDGEEVNVDVLEISVKNGLLVNIIEQNVKQVTDNYFIEENNLYIELIDLMDYLRTKVNKNIIDTYDIFEANIKGDFHLYLGLDIA